MYRFAFFYLLILQSFIFNTANAQSYDDLNLEELEKIAQQYFSENRPDKAIPVFHAIFKQIPAGQDSLMMVWKERLAFLYVNTGQFGRAIPLIVELKEYALKKYGNNHPIYTRRINFLAKCNMNHGNFDKAEALWEEGIKIVGPDNPSYFSFLGSLAALYRKAGSYELAEPLFIQVKNHREKTYGKNTLDYTNALNNLASLYQSMGLYNKAKPLFIEAVKTIKELKHYESEDYSLYSSNLGTVYFGLKDYKSAEPIFLEALEIDIKKYGDYSTKRHLYLNNLGNVYRGLKNYPLAESYFLKSLNIFETNNDKYNPDYTYGLNQLTLVSIKKKDSLQILTYAHRAIQSSSQLDLGLQINLPWADSLKTIPSYSYQRIKRMLTTLQYLHQFYQGSKGFNKQKIIADVALSILANSKNKFTGTTDKLRMLSLSNQWMLRSLKNIDFEKDFEKAFELIEKDKLVLLQQASQNKSAYQFSNFPDSLIKKEQSLQNNKQALTAKLFENRGKQEKDSLRGQLNEVNHSLKLFKEEVEAKFPKYTQFKYQELKIDLPKIQSTLGDKKAIIEYALDDSLIYIFYISQAKTFIHTIPVEQEEFKKRINDLHYSLSNYTYIIKNPKKAFSSYTEHAYWFYKMLLAPVLNKEAQIDQLIFITDRELGHLPFEVFLEEEVGQIKEDYSSLAYLVNNYKVSYNYSTNQWLNTQKESSNNNSAKYKGSFFAMAANYNSKIDSTALQVRLPAYKRMRESLVPLPAARKEIAALSEKFVGFFGFDSLATEQILKEKIADYEIIHLATHGLLDSKHPIMSSIALTEDNSLTENNFLHAYEISKLNLNAKLVVLSACETGYGKFEKGNGIASLARSFMYAGAPALVVSLWQVNDQATSNIMTTFYTNISNGMNKSEALQAAKLNYMERAKGIMDHPAFWSPFVLIGNESPIYVAKKSSASNYYIYGGIVLTILFGLAFFIAHRRKKERTINLMIK